ncbi:hypothetical protein QYE76_044470 [Lolium multiflorum]|uniref:Uncharacterized protein n=1 Tax=Lolium multiflorum TaxID=4521 RepID=A0AAD8TKU0_LOLMU|nr:hypothetical protein QYE76_044470 [Lolium multiflorum]
MAVKISSNSPSRVPNGDFGSRDGVSRCGGSLEGFWRLRLLPCHLFVKGIDPTYQRWVHHGEPSDAVVIVHGNELPENHEEVNHLEDFDARVIEHPVVPDDGSVNHALEFDMKSTEYPIELPDNSPDHGSVNHAENFDANAIEHLAEVLVDNDASLVPDES